MTEMTHEDWLIEARSVLEEAHDSCFRLQRASPSNDDEARHYFFTGNETVLEVYNAVGAAMQEIGKALEMLRPPPLRRC
jgi:hypothetical protein